MIKNIRSNTSLVESDSNGKFRYASKRCVLIYKSLDVEPKKYKRFLANKTSKDFLYYKLLKINKKDIITTMCVFETNTRIDISRSDFFDYCEVIPEMRKCSTKSQWSFITQSLEDQVDSELLTYSIEQLVDENKNMKTRIQNLQSSIEDLKIENLKLKEKEELLLQCIDTLNTVKEVEEYFEDIK